MRNKRIYIKSIAINPEDKSYLESLKKTRPEFSRMSTAGINSHIINQYKKNYGIKIFNHRQITKVQFSPKD